MAQLKKPVLTGAYLAPNATVVGDVVLEENVGIWHGAVLRGDLGAIRVGKNSNIQDNCVVHEQVSIGSGCTVGHGAIIHGCTIGDNCLIGMGAIILNGAVLGEGCLVGAGALVTGKINAPAGSLLVGSPAKVLRPVTEVETKMILDDAETYVNLAVAQLEKQP